MASSPIVDDLTVALVARRGIGNTSHDDLLLMNSVTVTYDDADHLILISIHGPVNMTVVDEIRSKSMKAVADHNCMRALVDLRDAQPDLSSFDLFFQPHRTADELATIGRKETQFFRALIVGEKNDEIRYYTTVAENRGHPVKLFYDEDSAKTWLVQQGIPR